MNEWKTIDSAPKDGRPDTDNADWRTVLKVVRGCAMAWEPSARLLGNVRAKDIVRAIDTALCESDEETPSMVIGAFLMHLGEHPKHAEELLAWLQRAGFIVCRPPPLSGRE